MTDLALHNPHQQLIQDQLPAWAGTVQPEHWQRLRESVLPEQGLDGQAPWFANAAPDLREAVLASQRRLDNSQYQLARALAGLQNVAEFAEALLDQRLKAAHQLSVPLRTTQLIHIQHRFSFGTYVSDHKATSLLEAALHNFEEQATFSHDSALALAGDAQCEATTVVGQTTLGDSDTLVDIDLPSESYRLKPLPLTPNDFARSCRDLDIGQRYQEHLQTIFETPSSPVRADSMTTLRDRLHLAADMAFLRHTITGTGRDVIEELLAEAPVRCWQPSLFGITLHEVLIIDAGQAGLLLYLPGDEQRLLQFPGLAGVHAHLATHLLQADYRRGFQRYVSSLQCYRFLDLLHQNLDAAGTSPTDQLWSMREGADLHLTLAPIEAPLLAFLYDDHVARLKAEAAAVAVPTAEVDKQAHQRRIAQWQSMGMDALMVAGFFIPGVGTLLTGVITCQLLGEVIEGYQAWSIGDRHLALQHIETVGLNLAAIGGLHAAGKVLPKLFNSALMESLEPVKLQDGSKRLWRADLTGYASTVQLPAELEANPQGLQAHQGRQFIRMDGQQYEIAQDGTDQRWRVVHPSDPEAYRPLLEHNGEGAWRGEHETPQDWSDSQCIRRLGLPVDTLDDVQLQQAMVISGVDRARLQAVHLAGEATPALLADTLERLTLARQMPKLDGAALTSIYRRTASTAEQRLCETYAQLTPPLARRLLTRLSPEALADWHSQGALPAWLHQQAEQITRDLPLARALEGLYQPRLADSNSERLLLACIERHSSWPEHLRLEIREANPEGRVLAAIGEEQASERCVLLRSGMGYEVFKGERPEAGPVHTDAYQALYTAAPSQLKEVWGSAEALGERTQRLAAAEREKWPMRLWGPQAKRPTLRHRLRGGAPVAPLAPSSPFFNQSVPARLRRLYPSITQEQVERLQADWSNTMRSAETELRIREDALRQLRSDLDRWATAVPRRQPAVRRMLNAWQQNSIRVLSTGQRIHSLDLKNFELENSDLAALALPAGFSHIADLDLSGNSALSELPAQWLHCMPELQRLTLSRCRFAAVPEVPVPGNLQWLDLEYNRISWDARAQAALERLSGLRVLDLSQNPLLHAPNLQNLPRLGSVFMVNCDLTELPQGLQRLESVLIIDLSENQFQRLPRGFTLPVASANALALESPGLGLPIREQIEDYYQLHGADLLVSDIDYQPLLAEASARRLQLWSRVPLHYRRELRQLIEDIADFDDFDAGLEALWRCLERMDADPAFRELALDSPAAMLLDL
ncbi:leucine-rich repeat domain-containing protein [Pseudomonas sp. GD03746]|uniref:leucine-rich repeat domain-containing protein n=1 Tax=Pseudomonas sp. GD03746 TaxID=2975378 RepID=UPI00244AB858|nr:leucine-rich repeat domain-containing protein [Pseudomonas sp. GD03746]MDH1573805.1 leucine-rich repeat domain-containing protein [Pseudomonas sp. GD03746]